MFLGHEAYEFRALETTPQHVSEMRMVRRNGAQFWARVEAVAAPSAKGVPVLRVVISDITERKQAEAELSARKGRLAATESCPAKILCRRRLQSQSISLLYVAEGWAAAQFRQSSPERLQVLIGDAGELDAHTATQS